MKLARAESMLGRHTVLRRVGIREMGGERLEAEARQACYNLGSDEGEEAARSLGVDRRSGVESPLSFL